MHDSTQETPLTQLEVIASLTDDILAVAEKHEATVSDFYNALGLAFLMSFVLSNKTGDEAIPEEKIVRGINKFTDMLVAQATTLMVNQPNLIKEKSQIILSK